MGRRTWEGSTPALCHSSVSGHREGLQSTKCVCVCWGGGGEVAIFCWKGYKNNSSVYGNEPILRNQAQGKELFPQQVMQGDGGALNGGWWSPGAASGWGEPMLMVICREWAPCWAIRDDVCDVWVQTQTCSVLVGEEEQSFMLSPNCTSELIPPSLKRAEQRAAGSEPHTAPNQTPSPNCSLIKEPAP